MKAVILWVVTPTLGFSLWDFFYVSARYTGSREWTGAVGTGAAGGALTGEVLYPTGGVPELVEVAEEVHLDHEVELAADAVQRVVDGNPARDQRRTACRQTYRGNTENRPSGWID